MKLNKRATIELTPEEVIEALNDAVEAKFRYNHTFERYQYGDPRVSFTPLGGAILIYEPEPEPEPKPEPEIDVAKEVFETAVAMTKFAGGDTEAKP